MSKICLVFFPNFNGTYMYSCIEFPRISFYTRGGLVHPPKRIAFAEICSSHCCNVKTLSLLICNFSLFLKEQGHLTVNKPVISRIYIVAHTWPLCSAQIVVDG